MTLLSISYGLISIAILARPGTWLADAQARLAGGSVHAWARLTRRRARVLSAGSGQEGQTMAATQSEKAARFRALHQGPGAFVIPNPWDAGSARILAALGFPALATSSGAKAGVLGKRDGKVTRDESLANARMIVEATDLPVSADLEKGFGDAPSVAAETIRLAAGVGLVGGSVEDATGDRDRPLYDIGHAAERVAAAAEAARALAFPFTLTARTENFLRGNPSLDDTIS